MFFVGVQNQPYVLYRITMKMRNNLYSCAYTYIPIFSSWLIYFIAVMRVSTPKKTQNIEGRHIASLTNSETVILNLEQLQKMAAFCYEVVFINDPDLRIYAYEHSEAQNCYIFIVPLCFYQSTKNKSKSFIELICLYSQSITVPTHNPIIQQFEQLLNKQCLGYHKKKGNNVVKMYIEVDCWCSYLDFVTSQAIQFKAKNSKELLAMKKYNAYEYCLNAYKQELLPDIYQNSEDSIEHALQFCISEIKELYHFLACFQRFGVIYNVMKQEGCSFSDLLSVIQMMATAKNITTVGDDECEQMINQELAVIIRQELNKQEKQINRMKPMEQQVFLVKITSNLLEKLRQYNFDITDQKYLFLSSKIIEKVYQLHEDKLKTYLSERIQLQTIVQQKDLEIQKLKREVQQLKATLSSKKQTALPIIKQEGQQQIPTVKRVQTEIENYKSKHHFTLKDLKEPLQVINTNVSSEKLHKIPLSKAKEKLKEGIKKRDQHKSMQVKTSLKS